MKISITGITHHNRSGGWNVRWRKHYTTVVKYDTAIEKLAKWKYDLLMKETPRFITGEKLEVEGFILGLIYAEYISYEEAVWFEKWIFND